MTSSDEASLQMTSLSTSLCPVDIYDESSLSTVIEMQLSVLEVLHHFPAEPRQPGNQSSSVDCGSAATLTSGGNIISQLVSQSVNQRHLRSVFVVVVKP